MGSTSFPILWGTQHSFKIYSNNEWAMCAAINYRLADYNITIICSASFRCMQAGLLQSSDLDHIARKEGHLGLNPTQFPCPEATPGSHYLSCWGKLCVTKAAVLVWEIPGNFFWGERPGGSRVWGGKDPLECNVIEPRLRNDHPPKQPFSEAEISWLFKDKL